jgi:hypothetical protein
MAETSERRAQAIALRIAGLEWQEIANRLGYASRGAACTDVSRALESNRREERAQVEELRFVESQRLDRLQVAVWAQAIAGDPRAVEAALKVMDRRAKLFGLDASKQMEIAFTRRTEMEADAVADAVAAALDALELTPEQRVTALGAAQERLLALEPGAGQA